MRGERVPGVVQKPVARPAQAAESRTTVRLGGKVTLADNFYGNRISGL
jgi:hypothetical protein